MRVNKGSQIILIGFVLAKLTSINQRRHFQPFKEFLMILTIVLNATDVTEFGRESSNLKSQLREMSIVLPKLQSS